MRQIFTILIFFMFFSCKKSTNLNNSNSPQNDLELQLSGHWQVVKYIISNFDTTQGRPNIPNDTIYPIHTETYNFSKDSLSTDSWQNNNYYYTTNPYTFENTQTKEFSGSYFCSYGKKYYVTRSNARNDTSIIISISASQLIKSENVPITSNPSKGILYTINTYLQK